MKEKNLSSTKPREGGGGLKALVDSPLKKNYCGFPYIFENIFQQICKFALIFARFRKEKLLLTLSNKKN